MTIDPTDFRRQGKPTPQQARAVWDGMAKPTARAVTDELAKRGFDIAFSTVARWKRNEWRELIPVSDRKFKRPLVEAHSDRGTRFEKVMAKGTVRPINDAIRAEIAELPALEQNVARVVSAGGLEAAVAGPPDVDEMRLIEARHADLMLQSEAELDVTEGKARKVFNILLMESAARRTRVLALIPKEVAALVTAMTGAAGAQRTGGVGQPPAASDPRTIEGTINQAEPDNEVSAAISMFRRKMAGEKVA